MKRSGEVRHDVVQLYTSARRDMIMCPGTDSED